MTSYLSTLDEDASLSFSIPVDSRQKDEITTNYTALETELHWLENLIQVRVQEFKAQDFPPAQRYTADLPKAPRIPESAYARLLKEYSVDITGRILLALGIAQRLQPTVFQSLLSIESGGPQPHHQVGGQFDKNLQQFLPNLQTAVFLCAGCSPTEAAACRTLFHRKHPLFKEQVLQFKAAHPDRGTTEADPIELDHAFFLHLLNSEPPRLDLTENFPAQLLKTDKTMDDLVLSEKVLQQLKRPMDFVQVRNQLFTNNQSGPLSPGFVLLLYGPPGTGKTLTATVLGNTLGIEVYRVNLSRVISKYIGETEKNLERIFDRLEQKNCILFFDEADALFGKRTEITEAKDRYANQEVAYLLQKIETFPNLVILSTNYRQNLDDAFQRRILSYIHVEAPKEAERLQLWQTHLPPGFAFDPPELLEQLAKDYQLTGANIANILKLASIEALSNQQKIISFSILEPILKQEFSKERRIFEVRQDRERRSNKYQLPNHATKSPRSAAPGNASKPRVRDVYDAMRIKLAEGEAIKNQKKLDGHGN